MRQAFELNVRTWRAERSAELGRPATLDDLGYEFLDHLVEDGFNWLYLLGVWRTGERSRRIAQEDEAARAYLQGLLPDLSPADVAAPPDAISGYVVCESLGGDAALARLRTRARECGLSLMLDFVPNHVGLDHPWLIEHPEYFIQGDEHRLRQQGDSYVQEGGRVFAHGRDPNFAPWRHTVQLDYSNPAVHEAMLDQAALVASHCDGLKVDEAMLVLDDVFAGTWGRSMQPFWPRCVAQVRASHPGTLFLAEVYWNLEYRLQQDGFDFTFDKILYDRLTGEDAESVRAHLRASLDYQKHCVRFLENEDEQRAAARWGDPDRYRAALFVAGMVPGMLLCHNGQEDGRRIHAPLCCLRRASEEGSAPHRRAYRDLMHLLAEPARHDGVWRLLEPWGEARSLVGFLWTLPSHHQLVVVVNLSRFPVQGAVDPGLLAERDCQFTDCLNGQAPFQADADQLRRQGLAVRLPAWGTAAWRVIGR